MIKYDRVVYNSKDCLKAIKELKPKSKILFIDLEETNEKTKEKE